MQLGASNPTALLAFNGSENSFQNEVSMEIDSQSDCTQRPLSVAEELDMKMEKDVVLPERTYSYLMKKSQPVSSQNDLFLSKSKLGTNTGIGNIKSRNPRFENMQSLISPN